MRRLVLLFAVGCLGLAAPACRPMTPVMPAATLARAQALPEGTSGVAIAAGLGAGGVGWSEGAGGGTARVRVAVADAKELDLSGQVIGHQCAGCSDEAGGKRGLNLSVGGRVGTRIGLTRRSSILGGAGLAWGLSGTGAGIDLGYARDLWDRYFVAGRGGIAVPIDKERYIDNKQHIVGPRTTGYGVVAFGFRTLGPMGLVGEVGLGGLGTREDGGLVGYVAIGVEQIGKLW